MNTDKKGFLEELRSLSEPVKHKIFLITAAASMILIVYLWLAYFNTIVPNAAQTAGQTSAAASTSNGGEGGAFRSFRGCRRLLLADDRQWRARNRERNEQSEKI